MEVIEGAGRIQPRSEKRRALVGKRRAARLDAACGDVLQLRHAYADVPALAAILDDASTAIRALRGRTRGESYLRVRRALAAHFGDLWATVADVAGDAELSARDVREILDGMHERGEVSRVRLTRVLARQGRPAYGYKLNPS
jgi:ATP/maltotriose-dependent transcriptional regulator MalT